MLNTKYKFGEVKDLASQIEIKDGKVDFKQIFDNNNGGITLVSIKGGSGLAEHLAPAELMVYVLKGEIEFTMISTKHTLREGEFILVGNDVPHSVKALSDSKMMLVKIKP